MSKESKTCQICGGIGWVNESAGVEPCDCSELSRLENKLRSLNEEFLSAQRRGKKTSVLVKINAKIEVIRQKIHRLRR